MASSGSTGPSFSDIADPFVKVFDSVMNFLGVKSSNSTNMKMNEANLKQQRDLFNASVAQSDFQWLRDAEYNDPSNVRQRLENAGLNPFLTDANLSTPAPSANAPTAAGGVPMIPNQPQHFDLSSVVPLLNASKVASSQSYADYAKGESELIHALPILAKYMDPQSLSRFIDSHFKGLNHDGYRQSSEYQMAWLNVRKMQLENRISDVAATVAEKYGDDRAQQEVWNLQQQSAEIVTRCGLYNSLAKLNDSNIERNNQAIKESDAKIKELASEVYRNLSEANYKQKLGLTEDQLRQLTHDNILLAVGQRAMDFGTQYADYEEQAGVREYKQTGSARTQAVYDYGLNHNAATSTLDFVGDRLNKYLPVKAPAPQLPKAPWQTGYVKRTQTRPTYSGKENIEWYDPR